MNIPCQRNVGCRIKSQVLCFLGLVLATAVTVLLLVLTPWEDTPPPGSRCRPTLRFSPVPLPVTALCSVQGSGNTWLRHLLQQLTGIYTGSIYNRRGDPELWARGYYGEGVHNGSVVAIKTHGLPSNSPRQFARAIILIRNPYDAMLADFNRRASGSHTGVALTHAYMKHWETFPEKYAERWAKFYTAWGNFTGVALLVNFDNLVYNLEREMERISAFVKHPSLDIDVSCAIEDSKGYSKRQRLKLDRSELLSPRTVKYINTKIDFVQSLFKDQFPDEVVSMARWKLNASSFEADIWKPFPSRII